MPDQDNQQTGGQGPKDNTSRTQQGQPGGQAAASATEKEKDESPSNSGNAGFGSSSAEAQGAGTDRVEQMSHADGSDDEPNPDV